MYIDDEICDDCTYCMYDSVSDCYICDLTSDRIEWNDECCDDFLPA